MEHSERFELVKKYFENGNWDENRVRKAVGKWITEEEFKEITGKDF